MNIKLAHLCGVLCVLCVFVWGAKAATFTVTTTSDAGAGSLRQAILDAEGSSGADTINVAVTGTVNLASSLPTITQSLTINGGSQSNFVVSGQGILNLRPFTVNAGGAVAVNINNLTVTNGNASLSGGGIYVRGGATLTLTSVTVTNNQILGGNSGFGGAGIAAANSTLNVVNSEVTDNTAPRGSGGGIRSDDSALTITNSIIRSNLTLTTNSPDGGYGGGIFVLRGTLTMTGSTVQGNNPQSFGVGIEGGGLYLRDVTARIENSSVFSNASSANGNPALGGGLSVGGGTLRASNLSVYSNSARSGGGGLYLSSGDVTLRNTTIAQNNSVSTAASRGGGIYSQDGGAGQPVVRLANTIIAGNSTVSSANGSDFYAQDTAVTLLTYNIVQNGIVGSGNTTGGAGTIGQVDPVFSGANGCGQVCTIAIAASSPARDAGTNGEALDTNGLPLTTDARGAGFPRLSGTTVDLGAFEYQFAPTAANVSIGGRVLQANGRDISGATVTLTDANGATRAARTNSFGYYRFTDVPAGATYVVSAAHKQFAFTPLVVNAADDLTEVNLVGTPNFRLNE